MTSKFYEPYPFPYISDDDIYIPDIHKTIIGDDVCK